MAKSNRSASEFLEQLPTDATRKNFRSGLKLYFTYISEETLPKRNYLDELDRISLNYLANDPDFEQDYARYQNHLKTLYAPKTVELRMLAVRSYLDANDIELKTSFLKRVNGRKAIEPVTEEKVPRREEVKLILQHLPLHIKSYALFLISGGMRPGEPLTLTLKDIEDDPPITKIHLRAGETKTGRKRWTYITPEATQTLELWLESREQFIQSTAESISSNTMREKYLQGNQNKVFPFSYTTCNKVWATALKKAGLDERDDRTDRLLIRLHNLRKYFSTRGKWSDRDIPDYFQGHIRGVRAVYNRYDQAEQIVREEYMKAVPSLTIEEYSDTGKVEELESRLSEEKLQRENSNENINYLLTANRELTDRLRSVENESRLLSLELKQVQSEGETQTSEIGELRSVVNSLISSVANWQQDYDLLFMWLQSKGDDEIIKEFNEVRKRMRSNWDDDVGGEGVGIPG